MLKTVICGIPCQVAMTAGRYVPGSYSYNAPSDVDFYGGWFDVDFAVYDRRGRPAPWLERKMTPKDVEQVLAFITENSEP